MPPRVLASGPKPCGGNNNNCLDLEAASLNMDLCQCITNFTLDIFRNENERMPNLSLASANKLALYSVNETLTETGHITNEFKLTKSRNRVRP